jgi:DNA-binding MarR family transcriptional regulator
MNREDIGKSCFNLALRRAARTSTRVYDQAFKPLGITSGQFSILTLLSEEPVPSFQQIADAMALDRTTLSAALKPMERRGLVVSLIDPEDRRRRPLGMTPVGREIFLEAVELWKAAQSRIEESIGVDRVASLLPALARFNFPA